MLSTLELEQLKQVVQKQMEKQPQPQRTVPNANMQASSSQGKESYSSIARKRAKSTANAGSGNYTALNAPKPPDNGESSTKEKVAGARRVWGTVKSCTSGTIKGAIARTGLITARTLKNNKSAFRTQQIFAASYALSCRRRLKRNVDCTNYYLRSSIHMRKFWTLACFSH